MNSLTPYRFTITPRFGETDGNGHINNCSIAAWFEAGRTGYMAAAGGEFSGAEKGWYLVNVNIDYIAEAFFGNDVTVEVCLQNIGTTSLKLAAKMYQNDKQFMRGQATLVHFDKQLRQKAALPSDLKDNLKAFLMS